ncbi:MAG: hypothetical protein A2156_15245 [Deltaproteobacteria bacterium RBG_16_48_10]|nr:MAG: hypothetical protein A2156_15245 [Deltaproteobacteria bacterium RBG_16_48_10]
MEEVQGTIEKVKTLIQEGKSGEEIFQFLSSFLDQSSEIVEKLAEQLATLRHEKTARILLGMLEETKEKRVRKTIKRSLYRLRGKGISFEEAPRDRGRSILRPLQTEPPEGFGTGMDFLGHRLLILVIPHAGRGVTVLDGVISDTQGLINFTGAEMTRKEFKGFFENLREKSLFPLVEMEAPYVGFLFSQAYQLTLGKKGTPPEDYLHSKNEIERVKKEYGRPLIYAHLPKDEIEGDGQGFTRGADLLKDDLFVPWIIEEDEIRPYGDALGEAQESKLFLNQAQKEARFQEIYLKAMTEIFSEERRRLYQHRLEETAYIFYKLGKEEEARLSLSVAVDLERPLNPFQPHPFLFQLVVKSIRTLLAKAQGKREKEPSLIVKP